MKLLAAFLILFLLAPALVHAASAKDAAQQAANLVNAEKYAEAVSKYLAAIELEPENASLHLSLGLVYQATENYPEAIRAILKSIELESRHAQAHYSLALLYEARAVALSDQGDREGESEHLLSARSAWKEFLRLEKKPKRRKIARKHLAGIKSQLSGR